MQPVYLGLFSKIFNAIFDAILKPVIEFVGKLLNSILSFLFDEVLKPLLINVFFPMFRTVCEFVFEILADIFFELYTTLLWLVDLMAQMFNIFGGVEPVTYKGKETYLMIALLNMSPIMRVVWFAIGLGFILMLLFSGVSVIRSIGELGNEVQRPLAKVLHSTFTGFCKMVAIPFVCLLLLFGTSVVLNSASKGLNTVGTAQPRSEKAEAPDGQNERQGQDSQNKQQNRRGSTTTIGRCIFAVSTLDAAILDDYNITHTTTDAANGLGVTDELRAKYYYSDYQVKNGDNFEDAAVYYRDLAACKKDFKVKDIDYLIGVAMGLLFLYTLARGVLTFIARVFYIFILTIAGPLISSTYPLDDGKKYEGWKELYVGEFFSAFGLLIGMQVYIMLIPVVMDGNVLFGNGTVEANYLIRLIMMAGGAWMIKDVGPLITGLVSSAAANLESTSNAGLLGKMQGAGMAAWDAGKMTYGAAKSVFSRRKAKEKNDKDKKEAEKKASPNKDDKIGGNAGNKANTAKTEEANKEGTGKDGANKEGSNKEGSNKEGETKGGVKQSWLGGLIVKGQGNDGKTHWGVNLGSKLNFGLKADGSVSGNVFGIGWKKGKDGKIDKVSVPFMRFKRGADGKMSVSKVKLAKGLQFRRSEVVDKDGKRTMGKMFCSDLSVIGMKKRFDADTGKVETLSKLGVHYAKTKNDKGEAEYVKTHRNFLGSTSVYDRDKKGNYHVVARKGFTSNRAYKLDKETGKKTLVSVKSFGGRSLYEDNEAEDDDDDDDTGTTGDTGDKKE